MQEILNAIIQLSQEMKELKTLLLCLRKSQTELFKESWIDGQEVSLALNLSQRSLQTLRSSGRLPFSKFNGKCYYKVSDLETILKSNYLRDKKSKSYD